MNRFRVNLHPAFFDPETPGSVPETQESPELKLEQELNELKAPILDEFKTFTDDFLSDVNQNKEQKILSRYVNTPESRQELRSDSQRFNRRISTKVWEKPYSKLWNEKIVQGFWHLILELQENKYFEGKNLQEETAKVKEKYWNEVKEQYINNVWFASDKKFGRVKDNLFWKESENYPANKIYCELTWASTIFKMTRTHIEWYNSDIVEPISLDNANTTTETMSERQNRNFLSNDLPEYLWDIRKTPWLLKWLAILPIFSLKEDRPSKVDREAINDFLKAANRIPTKNGKAPEMVLMESLHDNRLNTNSTIDTYVAVLESHWMDLDGFKKKGTNDVNYKQLKNCISKIMEVWSFYIKTQTLDNDAKDQHAIYLSVLTAIEKKGWVEQAVNYFKPIIEQAEKDKKTERKEWYENGEKLWSTNTELYEIAKSLGITDFTSATRLSEKKPEYFEKNSIEQILANLNNDREINVADAIAGWSKAWVQFLEIFRQVWKEKALSNLVEYAKLVKNTLRITYLPDALFDPKTIEADIKSGHTWLILLLQNVINDPEQDLYALLSGVKWVEWQDLAKIEEEWKIKEEAFVEAWRILKEKAFLEDYKELLKWKDNVNIQNFADLQASLASCLYDNYKLGIWVWSTLSFEDWAKWLQIWTWAQVRGDWVVLWLSVSYSKTFDVWKGWTMTPGLSAWVFLPIVSWKKDVFASVWLHLTADKKQIKLDTWTVRHYGFDAWYNILTDTAYLWWHDEWNKAEWINEAAKFQGRKFEQVIMWNLLDQIKEKTGNIIDITKPEVKKIIKDLVDGQKDIKEQDRENVVNGMLRMLAPHNNKDLSQPWVKYAIAQWVAEQYEQSWSENRKKEVTESAYESWYGIWGFWVVWTPAWGIYAENYITEHDLDGRGDRWWKEYGIDHQYPDGWTPELINAFNKEAWFEENQWLRVENGFIVIPKSIAYMVNVNEKLEWKMKKDKDWNILLHLETPMAARRQIGTASQSKEIIIWWKKWENFIKLDTARESWFTTWEINYNDILELGDNADLYRIETLDQVLNDIKKLALPWDPIQNFDFSKLSEEQKQKLIEAMKAVDKNKKIKIIMKLNSEWKRTIGKPEAGSDWRWVEIEYKSNLDMIDQRAKNIATGVYTEVLKIKDPRALHEVKHKPWPEYKAFNEAMTKKEGADYEAAKKAIVPIFERLIKDYKLDANNNGFKKALDTLNQLDWAALWQALMSIDNIFARSTRVVWKNGEYTFPREWAEWMSKIIASREIGISKTIENYFKDDPATRDAYLALIKASKDYRTHNLTKFKVTHTKAEQLNNTVWFNLWDKTDPERPLFNPEIYQEMMDLNSSEFQSEALKNAKNTIHKRAMEKFANNKALINPIKKALNFEGEFDIKEFNVDGEKWKLALDIKDKNGITRKVTLSAWMEFGYFTQCVNHTVVLTDISVETDDGAHLDFNSSVWEGTNLREWSVRSINSSLRLGTGISVTLGEEQGDDEESYTETGKHDKGKIDDTHPDWTTPVKTDPHAGNWDEWWGDIDLWW